MKLMLGVVAALLVAPPIARAQTFNDVRIVVTPFELSANGADEAAGVSFRVQPVTIGQPSVGVFSMFDCGYFSVTVPASPFKDGATGGWRVEITPVKVVDHAVTFRLRWVRAIDKGTGWSAANEDVEVTLQPGESRPFDRVPVPAGAKMLDGRPCATTSVSLRVSVDFPDMDRRLIGANVWLVERLPNGKERSQLQALRGVPHRPIPFYFDSVPDGTKRLDFFGTLVADPENGGMEITLETIRAGADPDRDGYQSTNLYRSTLHMKPDEIVEVALRSRDQKAVASASRIFSLRIQAKQIR